MASLQPCTKLTKQRHERNDDLQKWTAARCNRLLRQISSRISHLRRLITEPTDATRLAKRVAISNDGEQPERKRVRHRYRARNSRPRALSDSDFNVSTPPRVVRTLGAMRPHLASSPSGGCCPTPIYASPVPRAIDPSFSKSQDSVASKAASKKRFPVCTAVKLEYLSGLVQSEHLKTYQAILGWLEKLLKATEDRDHQLARSSLVAMCLRKVPHCLDEINAWDVKEAETLGRGSMWKTDEATAAIYEQLEAFGSMKMGWKPFKYLVRSHAIHLLSQAIAEGLFAPEFVALMAENCAHLHCAQEAESLLSACIKSRTSIHSDLQEETAGSGLHQIFNRALTDICTSQESMWSLLPAVGNAISNQQLSVQDIPVKYRSSIWRASLATLRESSVSHLGTRFLLPMLQNLATSDENEPWSEQDEKERALISLAAGIVSAALTAPLIEQHRRHVYILEAAICEAIARGERRCRAQDCGLFILAMARLFAIEAKTCVFGKLRSQSMAFLEALITRSDINALYRQTLALTCSTAHAWGRTIDKPSHEILDGFLTTLHGLSLPHWFAQDLRSEGAFVLAQKTKDLRDLAFAENISETRGPKAWQPAARTMFSGWKWEAGISEWVLPSPSSKVVLKASAPGPHQFEVKSQGLQQATEHEWHKGFMQAGLNAKSRPPRSNESNNATNRKIGSGTSQFRPNGHPGTLHRRLTWTQPRVVLSSYSQRQNPQQKGGRCLMDDNTRLCGNNDRNPSSVFPSQASSASHGNIGTTQTSSNVADGELRAEKQNREQVAEVARGTRTMRTSTAATSTNRAVRRKSAPADPYVPNSASMEQFRDPHRRTTVSLSSLALCPGSDDWDELL